MHQEPSQQLPTSSQTVDLTKPIRYKTSWWWIRWE